MQGTNSVIKEILNLYTKRGKCINELWGYVENSDNSVEQVSYL